MAGLPAMAHHMWVCRASHMYVTTDTVTGT